MLYRSHSNTEYYEDFGLLKNGEIHFYDNGVTKVSKNLKLSPVVRVDAYWVRKPIKSKCIVADTIDKKRMGLQNVPSLEQNQGMYFPYIRYSNVTFHQGSVPYSLDIIFIADEEIVDIKKNTKIGSRDKWSCNYIDGVIELNAGFCDFNNVQIGDDIMFIAG